MRKIILGVALAFAAFTSNSCASDDSNNVAQVNQITFTVDGVNKTYTVINIVRSGPEVVVNATTAMPSTEHIRINMNTTETGAVAVYDIMFFKTETNWYQASVPGGLTSVLQINSNNRLKGTFSGNFEAANDAMVVVTSGTFDMSY